VSGYTSNDLEVAVVIVNYRTASLTVQCLAALKGEKALLPRLKAIVVDGGSGDGSAEELAKAIEHADFCDWVSLLALPINGGFGWANNQAIMTLAGSATPPEFIHLLNPDTKVERGAVAALVRDLQDHPNCGAAGSQLLNTDGQLAASAFPVPTAGHEFVNVSLSERLGGLFGVGARSLQPGKAMDVDWVTGASVMFRSQALRETGLFDDGFFLYFEEVELMHRMRAKGWSVRHVPESRVVHIEGAATGLGAAAVRPHPAYWYRSRRRYFALTGGRRGVAASNLAWVGGSMISALKSLAGRSVANPARLKDLLRVGVLPGKSDLSSSVPAWSDQPGKPPAWMDTK
jgi:GT2 family glycosyltransferase